MFRTPTGYQDRENVVRAGSVLTPPQKRIFWSNRSSRSKPQPLPCTGQVRSGQVRPGQVRSGQVRSGQVRSGQVRTGQVRSGQVRSGQVRSGQVRSGQVRQRNVVSMPDGFGTRRNTSLYMPDGLGTRKNRMVSRHVKTRYSICRMA